MFKRLVWFGIGAAAGASGAVWAEQQVRRRLDALGPDHVVSAAGRSAKRVGRTVADAVAEGRAAMREREDELTLRRDVRAGLREVPQGRPGSTDRSRHATTAGSRPRRGPADPGPTRPARW
ncbi:MAG: hypothetical protein ACOYOP_05025 [Microthrixaceae bacterium]